MKGYIHIYCGDGKGKTTAAVGLAVRAAGSGKQVVIAQFLKGQPTSEINSLRLIPQIQFLRNTENPKFVFQMTEEEKENYRAEQCELLEQAFSHRDCDVLVLDEIVGACAIGMVDEDRLLTLLSERPEQMEVVMTGRDPSPALSEKADYLSEIQKVKHPYEKGVPARLGIEK